MDEPTVYQAADGTVHLIVRDGTRSGRLIRIVSRDAGKSWGEPVSTNYPDATSKNFAARLSNGSYYLINNPDPKRRDPLAVTFSADGWAYDRPLALRKNASSQRVSVRKSINGSFQYPHAMEHDGSLWVIYSTNKEDIEVSEFRIRDLGTK
jgi:predicted neuraminidase